MIVEPVLKFILQIREMEAHMQVRASTMPGYCDLI